LILSRKIKRKFVIILIFEMNNIFKSTLVFSCFLFCLMQMGCNSNSQKEQLSGNLLEIEHKLGPTMVPQNPSRIVVLDIGALETLKELGVTPIGIPKKYMPEYLDDLKNNPDIADVGSVIEPNFEGINALSPDLILMSTRQERFYEELNDIAPAIFIGTDNKDYLPSFRHNVMLLAKIVDKENVAEEKLYTLEEKIKKSQKDFEVNPGKALFLIYNNGKFSAFGEGSRFGFIHDVLHIKPVMELQDESVHGQRVSNELIADANPDYLFIVDRNAAVVGKKANLREVENLLIQQTDAFKNDKIFYLDPELWFISGGGLTSVDLMVDDIVERFAKK